MPDIGIHQVLVNGEPGLLVTTGGAADDVIVLDLNADNRIAAIRLIRNPDKLRHITRR